MTNHSAAQAYFSIRPISLNLCFFPSKATELILKFLPWNSKSFAWSCPAPVALSHTVCLQECLAFISPVHPLHHPVCIPTADLTLLSLLRLPRFLELALSFLSVKSIPSGID